MSTLTNHDPIRQAAANLHHATIMLQSMMSEVTLHYINYLILVQRYKNNHFTVCIQKCLLKLHALAIERWEIKSQNDSITLQIAFMKIAKMCMLNELEIATVLYLFANSDIAPNSQSSNTLLMAALYEVYYLVLYVKEMLSDRESFSILLAGQEANDLYSTPYYIWKQKCNRPYFNINFNDPLVIQKINRQYTANIQLKNKPSIEYKGNMNDLINNIFRNAIQKEKLFIQLKETDPVRFAIVEQRSDCESYEVKLPPITKFKTIHPISSLTRDQTLIARKSSDEPEFNSAEESDSMKEEINVDEISITKKKKHDSPLDIRFAHQDRTPNHTSGNVKIKNTNSKFCNALCSNDTSSDHEISSAPLMEIQLTSRQPSKAESFQIAPELDSIHYDELHLNPIDANNDNVGSYSNNDIMISSTSEQIMPVFSIRYNNA